MAVRTSVRNPDDKKKCSHLHGLMAAGWPLTLYKADLSSESGWAEAMQGCTYVMHVASPLQLKEPKDPNTIIRPAVDGTMFVLRAAANAGVKVGGYTSLLQGRYTPCAYMICVAPVCSAP